MKHRSGTPLALALTAALLGTAKADLPRSPEVGAVGIQQAVDRLPMSARFLLVGAHPDDEPSGVMAYVTRGLHAESAYLALNRGEGGQNEIGTELFDGLGIIRTDELLGARAVDGAKQYFSTVYDYGFSRTLNEALSKWDEQKALSDVVRVIRTFRPDVVVTFHADERVGHGHHQAAGYLAVKAFDLAGDPSAFPELGLPAWQPQKLYLSAGVGGGTGDAQNATLTVDVGQYDPILGRTYQQIGLEGRSYHRSQGMGSLLPAGSFKNNFVILKGKSGAASGQEKSFFDGVPTTLTARWANVEIPALASALRTAQREAESAVKNLDLRTPETTVARVRRGLDAIRRAKNVAEGVSDLAPAAKSALVDDLARKEEQFNEALVRLLGLNLKAVANDATVTPGQAFKVRFDLYNQGKLPVELASAGLELPSGWEAKGAVAAATLAAGGAVGASLDVTVAGNAALTRPYWRRPDNFSGRVTVDRPECVTLPYCPTDTFAVARVNVSGTPVTVRVPLQNVWADPKFGERSRLLAVVPKLNVRVDPDLAIMPLGSDRKATVHVRVENNTTGATEGNVTLKLPAGWTATQAAQPFKLARSGEAALLAFDVQAPANLTAGTYAIDAEATLGSEKFAEGYTVINYAHTEYRPLYAPARATINAFDLKVPSVKIGYVPGTGDVVPEALKRVGLDVTTLTPEFIASGDLSQFGTIVIGVRAYGDRPDLAANHARLMNYIERGGNMVVQYHRFEWDRIMTGGPGPFPTTLGPANIRVTEEDAPVRILAPEDPAFTTPNRITQADFEGWVQERGLYWLTTWDPRYKALLESHDRGEPEAQGGLVKVKVGQGTWTYAGYAFFRELPAGVPGAYRLFVNLLTPEGK
ncbi:PIG-L family deacetylase [Deinococcus yavapaiensis]|uniref:Alpha-galactosidase-like protein n=1 Tax=Deinococcus yavapaiensis KR-236 TaxID=694435 RepID=A0A318S4M2_9DEIO|nr:PIG-L family deacetylase [Deinococcus yavapaiensis]PYE50423.1 alpha-galactosidase-like protein [Deinococcus yavapaiensis KR-236]